MKRISDLFDSSAPVVIEVYEDGLTRNPASVCADAEASRKGPHLVRAAGLASLSLAEIGIVDAEGRIYDEPASNRIAAC